MYREDRKFDTPVQRRIVIDEQLRHDTVLWRYLDAAKLFDFFENSTLFFCRADHFSDKFEGAFTPSLRQQISDACARGEIDYGKSDCAVALTTTVGQLAGTLAGIAPDAPPWFEKLARQSALR